MRCYILISTVVALLNGADKSNETKIVSGQDTTIEEYPYQVSLQIKGIYDKTPESRYEHICGGSILNNATILTAAHCNVINIHSVRAGSTFRSSGGKSIDILTAINHPKYENVDYDVAVIKLNEALEFGPTIQPIEIQPIDQIIKDDTVATVTGWGRLKRNPAIPEVLQKVEVMKVNQQTCVHSYMLADIDYNLTDRMTCYSDYGKDVCQEDSGGPLVVGKFQVGIVSWAIGCARLMHPGVYTDLQNLEIHKFIVSQL